MIRSLCVEWSRRGQWLVAAFALFVGSIAVAAPFPADFPSTVTLPAELQPVFIISDELVLEKGVQRLVATTFDIRQNLRDGKAARRHFEELFSRLSWVGGFRQRGATDVGHFTDDGVSVDVSIEPHESESTITLSVRVERP